MPFRSTLDFILYDWLRVEDLTGRDRHSDHNRQTFDAVLDTCERLARDKYAPFNRLVDTEEPKAVMGDDGALRVILPQATHEAHQAYAQSGMLSAAQDVDMGGMQLPYVMESAANSFFAMASVSMGTGLLTVGNANLLMAHGSDRQIDVFARKAFSGEWSGTMCLSEPQAGSSLADITTRAVPDGDDFESDPLGPRYRIRGHKMWISAGEHDLSENIVHLVLAKTVDDQGQTLPGVKGISLFIVPKRLVDEQGQLTGERNDVVLAGLNHKCGWRGTTNTLLNFGEGVFKPNGQAGALAYRVGGEGEGLACMFHMMNEARIGIGMAAAMLGMAGYEASLAYARQRPQGRPLGPQGKDPSQPQIPIIEHADVKRMLLAQKAYSEGALALLLHCARLVDEQRTGSAESAAQAKEWLELLTPIAKSWPSEWCLEANSLAIQVLGGYGYTRDFPVEQYWRDNRLNMIHEGTHGIQAIDLLGRKLRLDGGKAFSRLLEHLRKTADKAMAHAEWRDCGEALSKALDEWSKAVDRAWQGSNPQASLANAVPHLQAAGHVVLAWIWLDMVLTQAQPGLNSAAQAAADPALMGRVSCARYFFRYELPKIHAWLSVVSDRDTTCMDMPVDAF